jgi:hypothetical protein
MEQRHTKDRRKKPTPMLSRYTLFSGKRFWARRDEDRKGGYYADRFGRGEFVFFAIVVLLNGLDGFLASYIFHNLGDMNSLLVKSIRYLGGDTFVGVTFILASICVLFLFLHRRFTVARVAIAVIIVFQIGTISAQLIMILLFHTL